MTIALDLPTVLFVLQASYIAGATALAYARYRSADAAGAEIIAFAFLVLAAGAMVASKAEVNSADYARLSLINITLGTLGYALFFIGAMELSRRSPVRPFWIVLLPPVLTLAIGLWTGFHAINWLRATVFNGIAAVTMLTAAWIFHRDGRAEPLPGRRIVTLAIAAAGLVSLVMAVEFSLGQFWPAPVLAFVLILTLMFAIALSVMILTMERAVVKLDRLAHTDMLTGLRNRRSFFATVPTHLEAGDAIVVFDADRFKKLNDSWGHAVGDEVLQAMARALSTHLESGDILARYGGEEFILFLPNTSAPRALAVANTMRAEVEATAIAGVRNTISAGIAISPAGGAPLKQLIKDADAALYEAKAAGRNTVKLSQDVELDMDGEAEVEPAG
ncbi:GGDEF domain-containing protein [Pleomorphomonas oryzae]|uniref:GGDEF domain-containing protein n=1 Tax=Pleomorphomonas oryzae TaxID=261934 RepID=UPI00040582A1|nr:GGDEF domain-containing protein [Pleomorphomonas oryzae]